MPRRFKQVPRRRPRLGGEPRLDGVLVVWVDARAAELDVRLLREVGHHGGQAADLLGRDGGDLIRFAFDGGWGGVGEVGHEDMLSSTSRSVKWYDVLMPTADHSPPDE